MSLLLLLVSFGLGFACCLVLLGKSEHDQVNRIKVLEQENKQLKIKYLNKCWDESSNSAN